MTPEHTDDPINNPLIGIREIGGQDSVFDLIMFRLVTMFWRFRKHRNRLMCYLRSS